LPPIETPRRVLHFAFDTSGERSEADRAALVDFCTRRGLVAPKPSDKHHLVTFSGTALRWEQHSEFTTYTWELPAERLATGAAPFHPPAVALAAPTGLVPQHGAAVVALAPHLFAVVNTRPAPDALF